MKYFIITVVIKVSKIKLRILTGNKEHSTKRAITKKYIEFLIINFVIGSDSPKDYFHYLEIRGTSSTS